LSKIWEKGQSQHLVGALLCEKALCDTSLTNNKIHKHSSLFESTVFGDLKSFATLTHGTKVTEHFTAVIYECSLYVRVLVPGRHFQPSLMFVDTPGEPDFAPDYNVTVLVAKMSTNSHEHSI